MMKRIQPSAFAVAIGFGMTVSLTAIWYPQDAYGASRSKVLADCTQQANQRKLGAASIKRKNFLRQCLRDRGFSGPP
jgi:hypothetical protein